MKNVIDLDKLLQEGRISSKEYSRQKSFAGEETASLAFNILIGFGVITTATGAVGLLLLLFPHGATAIVVGFALAAAGVLFSPSYAKEWGLLRSVFVPIDSITAAGALSLSLGGFVGLLVVTVLLLTGSVLAKSSLLAAMSVLSLCATVGALPPTALPRTWLMSPPERF